MRLLPVLPFVALGTVASVAHAGQLGPALAEPSLSAPPPAAPIVNRRAVDWTGFYVGADVDYGRLRTGGSSVNTGTAGIFGGYRFDLGDAVLGVEGRAAPAVVGQSRLPSGDRLRGSGSVLFSAGVPLTADGALLGSVAVGPTFMQTSASGSDRWATGATGRIGLDYMVSDGVVMRGSVGYTGFERLGSDRRRASQPSANLGLSFKF